MSDLIVNSSDANFEQDVLKADTPVLVDFWAAWCGPCKAIAPVLEELADDYKDKVKVVKIDVDDNPEVASQFGIRSIPTIMIFKEGEKVDMAMGLQPKDQLVALIDKHA